MELTDRQLAFVAAMEENGISEEATIAFMTLSEGEFDKS